METIEHGREGSIDDDRETDLELARRLESALATHDLSQAAQIGTSLGTRYWALAARIASRNCSRLSHGGARCQGLVERDDMQRFAFGSLFEEYVSRLEGKAHSSRPVRPALLIWYEATQKSGTTFGAYFSGGRSGANSVEEALRVWNRERGLRIRLFGPSRIHRSVRDPLREVWGTMSGDSINSGILGTVDPTIVVQALNAGAAPLGLVKSDDWHPILSALWWDACQPTVRDSRTYDLRRVAQYLSRFVTEEAPQDDQWLSRVSALCDLVDALIAVVAPEWHEEWLEHPRSITALTEEMGNRDHRPRETWESREVAR